MKYSEINKRFTEIVSDYLSKGWIINTATMSDSQGETANIDLTKESEIIRVLIHTYTDWKADLDGCEIIVGKCTDKVQPHSDNTFSSTIWNSNLDVISTESYYKIRSRVKAETEYGTLEEAQQANIMLAESKQ